MDETLSEGVVMIKSIIIHGRLYSKYSVSEVI